MPNPLIPIRTKQEITLGTANDDTKGLVTRVIESAEKQYRTLETEGRSWELEKPV